MPTEAPQVDDWFSKAESVWVRAHRNTSWTVHQQARKHWSEAPSLKRLWQNCQQNWHYLQLWRSWMPQHIMCILNALCAIIWISRWDQKASSTCFNGNVMAQRSRAGSLQVPEGTGPEVPSGTSQATSSAPFGVTAQWFATMGWVSRYVSCFCVLFGPISFIQYIL